MFSCYASNAKIPAVDPQTVCHFVCQIQCYALDRLDTPDGRTRPDLHNGRRRTRWTVPGLLRA